MKFNVWWLKKDRNFGDILTPYILDFFKIKYQYTELIQADMIVVGSIARHATKNMLVLGSGIVSQKKEKVNPEANWKFVRGPFTRQKILDAGGKCPEIYGDPAMLLPLFCKEEKKQYDIGIVPHYVDYEKIKLLYPTHKVINVLNDNPLEVAAEITKCRTIISSSLHGLIAAHAYDIPAAWINTISSIKGDGIKFKDHYTALGLNPVLSTIEEPVFSLGKLDLTPMIEIFGNLK